MAQITLRLYRQHDMDLIAFYRTDGFRFQKTLKAALRAYARKENFVIKRDRDSRIEEGYVPKMVQMHIYVDPVKDRDILDAISDIRVGYRSSFLKALFRKYMTSEPLEAYRDRDDLIFDEEKDYITDRNTARSSGKKKQSQKKDGTSIKKNRPVQNQKDKSIEQRKQADKQTDTAAQMNLKPGKQIKPAAQKQSDRRADVNEGRQSGSQADHLFVEPDDDQKKTADTQTQQSASDMKIPVMPDSEIPAQTVSDDNKDNDIQSVVNDSDDDYSSILAMMDQIAHS